MFPSRPCLLAAVLWCGLSSAMAAPGKSCEWSQPGHDPYMGDLPGAIDHYLDIPVATRNRLKERMRRLDYDDLVTIRSKGIDGRSSYEPAIRQMHFGGGRVCAEVTRQSWKPDHAEGGLAYCEDGFCVLVPFVCRNVSRIRQRPSASGARARGAAGAGAGQTATLVAFAGQPVAPGASGSAAGPGQGGAGLVMRSSAALQPGLRPAAPSRTDFSGPTTQSVSPGNGTPPPGPTPPVVAPPPVAVLPPTPPPSLPAAPLLPLPPITPRTPLSPVPEPGTGLLLMSGLMLLLPRALRAVRR